MRRLKSSLSARDRQKENFYTAAGAPLSRYKMCQLMTIPKGIKKGENIRVEHDSEAKYLERYAKELLEQLFPDKYANIENHERPDLLMGPDYGIEVTWAMFENQGQAGGILNHVEGKNIDQIDKRHLQTMERIKADFITDQDGRAIGYDPGPENRIRNRELLMAYDRKKEKCAGYDKKQIDLFIYPPLAQIDGWLGKDIIGSFFKVVHKDPSNPFHSIIVYEEPTLYLYNVADSQTQIRRGSSVTIEHCKRIAYDYSGWGVRSSDHKRDNPERQSEVG